MRLAIASDLHLEFQDIVLRNTQKADGLILVGDILVANTLESKGSRDMREASVYRNFLDRVSAEFHWVIYIAGNHEFYHGEYSYVLQVLRRECAKYSNVFFMEKNIVKIDDFMFLGGTLWTDMNKSDKHTLKYAEKAMNDYRLISKGSRNLNPYNTWAMHEETLQFIEKTYNKFTLENFVVIGHHGPSEQSIAPQYMHDRLMNGNFVSNLDSFILERTRIKLWLHGHTHVPFDYKIGETRVVCNPRGYAGYEQRAVDFELKFVDI